MDVDLVAIRELADKVRRSGEDIEKVAPLGRGEDVGLHAPDSELARNVRDVGYALDDVMRYHARILREFAENVNMSADVIEASDDATTGSLEGGYR